MARAATQVGAAYCARCGAIGGGAGDHVCARDATPGGALDPPRYCVDCGAKLTVQVVPHGYESSCLRCERRARFARAT